MSVHSEVFDGDSIGIVIVDHGSRRAESNRRHETFVSEWRATRGYPIVEPAHMELAEPSIGAAFDACVAAGAETVVIAPYLLWPGNHWDRDIPALAAEAAARHAGARYVVTAPLGPHPLLMEIVEDRIERCLEHALGAATDCELCAGTGVVGCDDRCRDRRRRHCRLQRVSLGDRVFVCGDHRDAASIQGAMFSGERTASAVLRGFDRRTPPVPREEGAA